MIYDWELKFKGNRPIEKPEQGWRHQEERKILARNQKGKTDETGSMSSIDTCKIRKIL